MITQANLSYQTLQSISNENWADVLQYLMNAYIKSADRSEACFDLQKY